MMNSFSTNATVAKIHAKYGKMLKSANYKELLNMQSVGEIAAYLKKDTRYGHLLSGVETNTIRRGHLEDLIRRSNYETYVGLCKFQQLDKLEFYNFEIIKEEIEQILSCILHINTGEQERFISAFPSYLDERFSYDMIELANSNSFPELLTAIKHTSYYSILKEIVPDSDGKVDYLDCEVKLRICYYSWLFDKIKKNFSSSVAAELSSFIKSQVDLVNFINSYRYREFFGADTEQIKEHMLPFYGRLGKNRAHKIYEAESSQQMIELFDKTNYTNSLSGIDFNHVETSIDLARYKHAKRELRKSQSVPVVLYAYMFLCDIEAMNLTSIVEGIRYKEPPSNIEKLLII